MAGLNPLVDKIRAKYPGSYDDMDDATLTKALLSKYPQYSDLAAPPAAGPHVDMQQQNIFDNPATVGQPSRGVAPAGKLSGLPGVNPHEPSFREAAGDVALAGSPMLALGSPAAAIKGVVGAGIGSTVARKGAQLVGAGPTGQDLSEIAGGVIGGGLSQAELPNAGAKAKAVGKVSAQYAASKIPLVGGFVRRPSYGDLFDAVTAKAPETAPRTVEQLRQIKNADPTPENIQAWWKARGGKFKGEEMPAKPMTGEVRDRATQDVVAQALPDAPKATQMRTQAQVDFYLKKGNVEGAQAALDKATGKPSDFPPPAPKPAGTTNDIRANLPENRAKARAELLDDKGVQEYMRNNLNQHGYMAESEARKEFIARNSTGVTKGDLVKAAGGSVPEKPVKYTKTPGVKSPPAGTTVPQNAEDMTAALQKSVEQAKAKPIESSPARNSAIDDMVTKYDRRQWKDLPSDFEADAVKRAFQDIKRFWPSGDIPNRIKASKARTFADLREALNRARGQ